MNQPKRLTFGLIAKTVGIGISQFFVVVFLGVGLRRHFPLMPQWILQALTGGLLCYWGWNGFHAVARNREVAAQNAEWRRRVKGVKSTRYKRRSELITAWLLLALLLAVTWFVERNFIHR